MVDPPKPPEAASDKPPGDARAEPLAGDVSRAGNPVPPPASRPTTPARPGEHTRTLAPPAAPAEPAPPEGASIPPFITAVQNAWPGAISHVSLWVGDWSIVIATSRLVDVARHLRDTPGAEFDCCSDLTATDWPPRAERFDVVYHLYSTSLRHRVRVKVRAADQQPVPSVTAVWPAANWLEREVYDLFGIRFDGHPDLRRILMPDDWQGHPQRKDYPLEGPGELLLEAPLDWIKLRQAKDIE